MGPPGPELRMVFNMDLVHDLMALDYDELQLDRSTAGGISVAFDPSLGLEYSGP